MERERERVDGAGDQVGSGTRGLDRVGHAAAARALAVEADRQPGGLGDARDELARLVRLQAARGVVDQRARRVQVGELASLLDERVGGALSARAVDEPGVELLAGADDRLAGLAQVRDVVERVVQAEDVDPVLRRGGDEAADEVAADRARADEEAAAEREPERRRRPALERADALPRALDTAAHRGVEDAAAGDLEAREPGLVEHLGERQQLGGRDLPRERLLREQADSGVYEPRHAVDPSAPTVRARRRPTAIRTCGGRPGSSRAPLLDEIVAESGVAERRDDLAHRPDRYWPLRNRECQVRQVAARCYPVEPLEQDAGAAPRPRRPRKGGTHRCGDGAVEERRRLRESLAPHVLVLAERDV